MTLDASTFIGPIITALITGIGVYVAFASRLSVVETLIGDLTKEVEKHNSVIERTYKVERDVATAFTRLDAYRSDIQEIKEEIK